MSRTNVIPQSEHARATAELLSTAVEQPFDLTAFYCSWMLHQAADTAREHQLKEALHGYSLSWTQFEVLWNMWIFGEREAGFVATAAMLSKSGLTTVLSQLDRRGLISRRADPTDGRKALVRLNTAGEQLARSVWLAIHDSEKSLTSNLTSQDKRELVALLSKLLSHNARGPSVR
jgi:DNA-binding MarR family transcriptional regulator